jgi:uncharacterized membrane protein YbaN (DUF454 family)
MTKPIPAGGPPPGRGSHRAGSPPPRRKPRPRRKKRSKAWNLALGIGFFILGIVGVLLPVVPQVPFFIMSLLFFSLVYPPLGKALRRFLRRHPKVAHAYKKWRDKARAKRRKLIQMEKEWFGSGDR